MNTAKTLLAGALFAAVCLQASAAQNLAQNGSFEEPGKLRNVDILRQKDFETPDADDADKWAKGWIVNPVTHPAKVAVVTADDAPDGKRYLHVVTKTAVVADVYTGTAGGKIPSAFRFQARGASIEIDGKTLKPKITVAAYMYGKKPDAEKSGFVGTTTLKAVSLDAEWKAYEGEVKDLPEYVTSVAFVFRCEGDVSIDDVTLSP